MTTKYSKSKRKQLEQLREIASLVRKFGSISDKELALRVSINLWTYKFIKNLVPTMYQDIEYDQDTHVWSAIAQTVEEKTVDPNTLDSALQVEDRPKIKPNDSV